MSKLSTLFINNLLFAGVHGSTGREVTDSQYFKIDVAMDIDIANASQSDALNDTYDYKHAKEAVRSVIENERHVLIERIAFRIAERICTDPKIFSAKVTIRKLHASQNGTPGISVSYKRIPQDMLV